MPPASVIHHRNDSAEVLEHYPGSRPKKEHEAKVTGVNIWKFYHRTSELLKAVEASVVESGNRCRLSKANAEAVGRKGDEILAVHVHPKVGHHKDRGSATKVMIIANEHGRELITAEVLLRFIQRNCHSGASDDSNFQLENEYLIVPIVNEWSRIQIEQGKWCARLNARGVDINRNYGYRWGDHDATSLPAEERPGRSPFSENESRQVRSLVRQFRPHVYVSLHSGDRALVMPLDSGSGRLAGRRGQLLARELRNIRALHCSDCRVGTSAELFKYNAFGTGVDHMIMKEKVTFAFTAEIYGNASSDDAECFRMFNPLLPSDYQYVVDFWANTFATSFSGLHLSANLSRERREVRRRNFSALSDLSRDSQSNNAIIGSDAGPTRIYIVLILFLALFCSNFQRWVRKHSFRKARA